MLDLKNLLSKITSKLFNITEYPIVVPQTVTSSSSTLAANTYKDETADFTRPAACGDENYYPIIGAWNISGTNSSYVHCLGVYISGTSPNYTLHVKCRNTGSSAVTGMVVTGYIRYIRTNLN